MKPTLKRILFVSDLHSPYENKRAWRVLLNVGKYLKPQTICIMGDFADFYCVSDYPKDPERITSLKAEVESVLPRLDELDSLGAKDKIYICGNHEDRLQRYLSEKCPSLWGVTDIETILCLRQRGWKYVGYKDFFKLGRLYITHDTGTCGKFTHYKASETDFQGNAVVGHTHRMGYCVTGNAKGKPHVGAMFGWLGDVSQVDYMHRIKALRDWSLGFGIGYLEPESGMIHLTPVPIVDYKAVVEGRLFDDK